MCTHTLRHIIFKFQETGDNEKILKDVKGKTTLPIEE